MRKLQKVCFMGATLLAFCCQVHAGVLAAWDFNAGTNNTTSAGWTPYAPADGTNSTVGFSGDDNATDGSITLTQNGSVSLRYQVTNAANPIVETDLALLTAAETEYLDGFDENDADIWPEFTLSGLEVGVTYRLQFVGGVRTSTNSVRGITMSVGSTTVNLFGDGAATNFPHLSDNPAYSEYLVFAADASSKVVTFDNISSGVKWVGGVIVETIEAPVVPPVVTALASDEQVLLSWGFLGGVVDYDVLRSITSGSGYTEIATAVSGIAASYNDTDALVNDTTYYYVVTANFAGDSTNSVEVSATPIAIATGSILDEDFTAGELYDDGDLAGQDNWIAISGSGPSAFEVDSGNGFADTEPVLGSFDTVNGNAVAWNSTMSNAVYSTWTGSIDFELNADAKPGNWETNTWYEIDEGGTTNGTNYITAEVGATKNLDHVVYEVALTPDTATRLSESNDEQITIQLRMRDGYDLIASFNASNNDRDLARLEKELASWDPSWDASTTNASLPDFQTDLVRLTYTIQKTAADGIYTAYASFSNLVSGEISDEEVTLEYEEPAAYAHDLMFFGMGKSRRASDEGDRWNVDIKLDSVKLDHENGADPILSTPSWAGLDAVVPDDGQLTLSWEPSLISEGYYVYRSLTNGGAYELVATVTNGTSYVDNTGLNNLWTYYYVLESYVGAFTSDVSDEKSGFPIGSSISSWTTGGKLFSGTGNRNLSSSSEAMGVTTWYTIGYNAGDNLGGKAGTFLGKSYHGILSVYNNAGVTLLNKNQARASDNPQNLFIRIDGSSGVNGTNSGCLYWIDAADLTGSASLDLTISTPYQYELVMELYSGNDYGLPNSLHAVVEQDGTFYASSESIGNNSNLIIEDLGSSEVTWTALNTTQDDNIVIDMVGPTNALTLANVTAVGWFSRNVDRIRVADMKLTVQSSFSGYEFWQAGNLLASPEGDPDSDPDNDGANNTWEYGLGGDPMDNQDQGTPPETDLVEIDGTNYLRYVYVKLKDERAGIQYYLENTDNLQYVPFTNDTDFAVAPLGDVDAEFNAVTNLIPTVDDRMFIQLQIEQD